MPVAQPKLVYKPRAYPTDPASAPKFVSDELQRIAAASVSTNQSVTVWAKVATPNNANAAAAGVPVGGFYTSTADPAPLYIRTV